jgi:hypothetical protein
VTGEELLESLDRHFLAGCPSLSTDQLREHQAKGTCLECRSRAAREKVSVQTAPTGETEQP